MLSLRLFTTFVVIGVGISVKMIDQTISDRVSDFNLNDWNQMEQKLKKFGYREGASKGREAAFQIGFDAGYVDGFKMGEAVAQVKGTLSCLEQLQMTKQSDLSTLEMAILETPSKGSCQLCPTGETTKLPLSDEQYARPWTHVAQQQVNHNEEIQETLKVIHSKICER